MTTLSILELVEQCDNYTSKEDLPFLSPNRTQIGLITPAVLAALLSTERKKELFDFGDDFVKLKPGSVDDISKRIAALIKDWKKADTFDCLRGWRNELYPVYSGPGNLLFTLERSAAGIFGLRTFGCHLNGYIRENGKITKLWIARRHRKKQTWGGYLDNTVGGGLSHGSFPAHTIQKECEEEANISSDLSVNAIAVGTISYITTNSLGICPETQYIYDLEFSPSFIPKPNDGEVEAFYLWSIEEVFQHLHNNEFKHNCGLVVIDFFVRHGIINPENEPNYLTIVERIHRTLPFPGPNHSRALN